MNIVDILSFLITKLILNDGCYCWCRTVDKDIRNANVTAAGSALLSATLATVPPSEQQNVQQNAVDDVKQIEQAWQAQCKNLLLLANWFCHSARIQFNT